MYSYYILFLRVNTEQYFYLCLITEYLHQNMCKVYNSMMGLYFCDLWYLHSESNLLLVFLAACKLRPILSIFRVHVNFIPSISRMYENCTQQMHLVNMTCMLQPIFSFQLYQTWHRCIKEEGKRSSCYSISKTAYIFNIFFFPLNICYNIFYFTRMLKVLIIQNNLISFRTFWHILSFLNANNELFKCIFQYSLQYYLLQFYFIIQYFIKTLFYR